MAGKKGKTKGRKAGSSSSKPAGTTTAATGLDAAEIGAGGGQQHAAGPADDGSGSSSGATSKNVKSGGGASAEDFLGRRRTSITFGDSETAVLGGRGDYRHTNGGTSAGAGAGAGPRRALGDRERDRDIGERDRDKESGSRGLGGAVGGGGGGGGDHCHNGESLCRSPYIRSSAGKQWSWLGYSAKQFRSFAQEFPPTLDVGAEEVRLKIEDIKCNTCRVSLLKALGRGLGRGGFPLTKLVKLTASRSGEDEKTDPSKRLEEPPTTTTAATATARGDAGDGRAPVVLSNGRSGLGDDSHTRLDAAAWGSNGSASGEARPGDRLRIRAPVTPDLLRQVIGVVQTAMAPQAADPTASPGAGKENAAADLSAEEWLFTYPAPNPSLLEAGEIMSKGGGGGILRGTGTGSLSFSSGGFDGNGGGRSDSPERNPWALMERVDLAKDNAFKCCGVIEASAGGSSSGGGLLESSCSMNGGGSSSTMATNMEWNPQFAPRLQEAEAAIVEWLTELTMALHGLTFQFTLAFIGSGEDGDAAAGNDLAESTVLAEDLWTAYEESVKRQLDLTLEARREQLREQSQPMGLALCFTAQNRVLASELLERKRAEMTALHEATIGVMASVKWRPLLERAERARQKWSGLLLPDDIYALDDLVERVLRARLQVFKVESFAYNASSDVIQAEQMADAQLKAVVQEWETMLDGLKARVEDRVSEELNPMVYPQSPALTSALEMWLSSFQADWVGNETTQQLHAHIRQRQVHQLCQTLVAKKQRLKATKDEANELGKQRRKRDARTGSGSSMFSPSAEQAEDMAKQREFEERCQSLATAISLTQQEQIETCLTYRLFAVGQLHQRYRRLRLFFAQLGCRVGARESQAALLCGGDGEAEERIKMVGVCLMLGVVEEACLRWTAVQNARQLVEGMNREDASQDAKRRKRERAKAKVRETKTAAAAAVAAAVAEAAEAPVAAAAAAAAAAAPASKEGPTSTAAAADSSPAQPRSEGGQGAAAAAAAAAGGTPNDKAGGRGYGQHPPSDDSKDSTSEQKQHQGVSLEEGWGKAAARNGRERSTQGWRGAERVAPAGDEDGFVTIAKSKPRRSTAAREMSFLQQNGGGGGARGWGGRGNVGGGVESGRSRGGGGAGAGGGVSGGYGFEGKDRAARDIRTHEQDRKSRAAAAAPAASPAAAAAAAAAAMAIPSAWAGRSKPVAQEQPELGMSPSAAPAASNGWPGVADANGSRRRSSDDEDQGSSDQQPASSAVESAQGGGCPATTASSREGSAVVSPAAVAPPAAPQAAPPPPPEGSPVAPEEELPEAALVATDSEGETAEGVANSTGGFRGREKVVVAEEENRKASGAGGAAVALSGEVGPEREVAGVTTEGLKGSDEADGGDGRAAVGGVVEEGDEEEFVFQFGTVNLSDEDAAGEDAGLDAAYGASADARHSPEYHDSNVNEGLEEPAVVAADVESDGDFNPTSPVGGVEAPFDGEGNDAGDGTGGPAGTDGFNNVNGGGSLPRQPLQTEQLRDGVFFPAHPPPLPPPQHQQTSQDARLAPPPFQHHNLGGGQIQQHHQAPHHQHQIPPHQQHHRGYSPVESVVHGMPQHHHQLHQHQPQIPMQQRGSLGMGGGLPVHNSGGMHHRSGPSHPKGPRGGGGGGRGGASSHSSNRGPLMPMGAGHYAGTGPQQQSAATGYWGGGMMHYQVPGQPMMGPAPGGIGVTDGQAVYYPPPPHMIVQGDGAGMHGHAGGVPWALGAGGGHMGMGLGAGMNMAMDMNGMPGASMPWMPDGGSHYLQQHPQHQQQGWGGSPTQHRGGMGYGALPLQQQQHQHQVRPMHAAPLHPVSGGGAPLQGSGHHRQGSGGQSLRSVAVASMEDAPLEHGQHQFTPVEHQEKENAEQEVTQEPLLPPPPQTEGQPESPTVLLVEHEVDAASPVGSEPALDGPVAPTAATFNVGSKSADLHASQSGATATVGAGAETLAREVTMADAVDGVTDIRTPEAGGKRQQLAEGAAQSQQGPAAAAMAAAAALEPATRPKRAKKEKGKKAQQGQQQSSRQGWATSNGVAAGQPHHAGSPDGGKRSKTKGSKAAGTGSPAESPAGSAKKDLPSPSAPMPRGLVNAMGQNNCFLNVVVQSMWHLEAFRLRFGGNGNSSSNNNIAAARGAWGKKPQVWNGDGHSATTATPSAVAEAEPSHRVESSLRALFRELSEVEGGGSAVAGGGSSSNGGGGGGSAGTTSASVEALRTALAELSGARFGAGRMDDAAEAMETILGCLARGSSASAIRQVFSMQIREALVCPKCGTSSPETPATYEANVFYVHVSALRDATEKTPNCPFDVALREASHGDLMTCGNAGCSLSRRKERLPSQRSITGDPPSVFSLGLVWNNWGPGLVADLLGMLSPVIDLDVVFCRGQERGVAGAGEVPAGKAHLRGFFCFQVQKHHYVAFVYNRGRQEWLLLDDDQAIPIGPDLAGVIGRCDEDKLHPSLFFFERQQDYFA